MKTTAIFVLLLISSFGSVFSQAEQNLELPPVDSSLLQSNQKAVPEKKIHVGATLDMSYAFSKAYSGPMMYFSPYLSYPLTNRLSLYAGVTAGYGSLYSPYFMNEKGSVKLQPMTQFYLFAASSYQVNQKLTVTGTAYKNINTIPNLYKEKVNANYSASGVSVGFNYKIAPGLSFGAQIRIDSHNSYPYGLNSGYPGNGFYNPGW
jgi:hypothetical protein